MIEFLEPRRLFSKIPLLLYPAPSTVASDALSIINATPTQVVASASRHVGSGQAPTQAMLDVIEYHEGYSLSIYPDSHGVPTVGVGIKLNSSNASFATAALAAAGVSYSALAADWSNIKSLFVSQHHPLASLKDTSPLWARFVEQNPSVADPVLTSTQATTAFSSAVSAKLETEATFIGAYAFFSLDRDPQIALTDFAYHVADIRKYESLLSQIEGYGNQNNGTDYSLVAKQLRPISLGSVQRARDDQTLAKHGEDASSLAGQSTITLFVNESDGVGATPTNAFGQSIVLPAAKLKWTGSIVGIISVKPDGFGGLSILGLRAGTTDLTFTDSPAALSLTVRVTVLPHSSATVTWQASGTNPDVDGAFSVPGKIVFTSDALAPRWVYSTIQVDATVVSSNDGSQQLSFSLQSAPYSATITLGSDKWDSATVDIIAMDGFDIAGTFSAGPNDSSGQQGSISGSFSGGYSLVVVKSYT